MSSELEGRRERQVLVLQGGGALGAYQAGVYEALHQGGHNPAWLAGISIGAINAALIAGNPPERRVERLRAFWEQASSSVATSPLFVNEAVRPWFNELSAGWVAATGVPGFFSPRFFPPILQPPGTPAAISFYDTAPLRSTLERLVDFDRINAGHVRLSVGAVHVTSGNFVYFDSTRQRIGPEHIMASGALPPGFPPVEIDGELYWDGGLVSNTPMQYVLDEEQREDLLVFQVDLFSARGEAPRTLDEAAEREKDIRFSSRTRLNTDTALELHRAKALARKLLAGVPPERRNDPNVRELEAFSQDNAVTVAHLIFRSQHSNASSKDYEFSRLAMLEHWKAGTEDVLRTLNHPAWIGRKHADFGVTVFDLGRGGPDRAAKTRLAAEPAEPQVEPQAEPQVEALAETALPLAAE
jgi:NTE family protein